MAARSGIAFVLFDLGGVLIDVGGVGPMRELSGISSDEELWARWLACRWVRRFEAGRCSPDAFAAGVVEDWGLEVEPSDFLAAFAGWTVDPYPGALELVDAVRVGTPVGCLSNTNVVQWESRYEASPLLEAFDARFLSFELGLVKPDRAIFDAVARRLPVPRAQVLFLDDNAVNVEAAAGAGFEARHVRGVDAARDALTRAGLLAGPVD